MIHFPSTLSLAPFSTLVLCAVSSYNALKITKAFSQQIALLDLSPRVKKIAKVSALATLQASAITLTFYFPIPTAMLFSVINLTVVAYRHFHPKVSPPVVSFRNLFEEKDASLKSENGVSRLICLFLV